MKVYDRSSRYLFFTSFYALASSLSLLLINASQVHANASGKFDELNDVAKQTAALKTREPLSTDKNPPAYIQDFSQSQTPRRLGIHALNAVAVPNEPISVSPDNDYVSLKRPALQAFISVQQNLSPFHLDAGYDETISLSEALDTTLRQNLQVENSFDRMKAQKFTFLSAASQFLPDLNAGYNLAGVHGTLPAQLLGLNTTSAGTVFGGNNIKLPHSVQLLNAGFTYNVYQGGRVLFSTLEERHRLRGSRAALKSTLNDSLLDVSRRYYELLLNEALLEIRESAVEISTEQVRLNTKSEQTGNATGLDVLQSEAQLASDEQNLVTQQNARRHAALNLATVINSSYAQDLTPAEAELGKRRMFAKVVPIAKLLTVAIDNRPELKQYEELRLAAKRAIVVAAAPLQPNVALNGAVLGLGAGGEGKSSTDMNSIFLLNLGISWRLGALGTTDAANIQRARWLARQASVDAKQQLQNVISQVRGAYDDSLTADTRIKKASVQIRAAEEELRIATLRIESGVGLNLDFLNAQRDLTQARVNKAQAIVDFNIAQVQLLHDTGLIDANSVMKGVAL